MKLFFSNAGRYEISDEGVIYTRVPLTTVPDHVFNVRATDNAGHYAVVNIHITIIGNKYGPTWIFPSYDGDKIVVCEVSEQKLN